MDTSVRCERCGREGDEMSADFIYWEATDSGVICEGCVTGAEQQANDEDAMDLQSEADLEALREIDRLS